jgi:hypothetical protein
METGAGPNRPRFRARRGAASFPALVASALLIAGCGGSASPSSSTRPGAATTDLAGKVVAFVACMRSHGLPGYPEPKVSESGGHGSIRIGPGGLDPDSTTFKFASRACGHLLPAGGSPSAITPQDQEQDLEYAGCMRSHGVPSFPDPDRDGVFTLPSGIDQQAPRFQRATAACVKVQPSSLTLDQGRPGGS